MAGVAADQVREAESHHRAGDVATAIAMLEEALEISTALRPELPGWLCGRLAALYRTSGRYDDEVQILERYRESQSSEEARTRYDARLYKARTIADRKRRSESVALASVRASLGRPRSRRKLTLTMPQVEAPSRFSEGTLDEVRAALADTADERELRLRAALMRLRDEARGGEATAEQLVEALKDARDTYEDDRSVMATRRLRYAGGLVLLLALHFEEDAV
jgi:tetratricopeptide (TPR) repeat protein